MQDLGQLFGAGERPERCLELILQIAEPAAEFGWQPAALLGIAQGLRARGLGAGKRIGVHGAACRRCRRKRGRPGRAWTPSSRSRPQWHWTARPPRISGWRPSRCSARPTVRRRERRSAHLLAPTASVEMQTAAVRAIVAASRSGRDRPSLVEPARWQAFTPQIREAVLSALIADEQQTPCCSMLSNGAPFDPTALGPSRRSRLMAHRECRPSRQRARTLFCRRRIRRSDAGLRAAARAALRTHAPNAPSGRQVFAAHCAPCHAVDGSGRTGRAGPERHPQPASRRHPASRRWCPTTKSPRGIRPTWLRPATGRRWSGGWNRKRPTA